MSFLGFLKDVALAPIDALVDVTNEVLEAVDVIEDDGEPSRTSRRMDSLKKNFDETYD